MRTGRLQDITSSGTASRKEKTMNSLYQALILQQCIDLLFLGFHLLSLLHGATLMVITEKVEDSMQKQKHKFRKHFNPGILRVAPGRICRNHHISQEYIRTRNVRCITLLLGKRYDIGRTITFEVIAVYFLNSAVINNKN